VLVAVPAAVASRLIGLCICSTTAQTNASFLKKITRGRANPKVSHLQLFNKAWTEEEQGMDVRAAASGAERTARDTITQKNGNCNST
jgi:hypothetical protein